MLQAYALPCFVNATKATCEFHSTPTNYSQTVSQFFLVRLGLAASSSPPWRPEIQGVCLRLKNNITIQHQLFLEFITFTAKVTASDHMQDKSLNHHV